MLVSTSHQVYEIQNGSDRYEPELKLECGFLAQVAEGDAVSLAVQKDGTCSILALDQVQEISLGIDEPIECLQILEKDPLRFLVGTEGPHIYEVTNNSVNPIASFDQLEERSSWYTPWGGPPAVRSFAATDDGWVYADIHVGNIMRSRNRGGSWEPVVPDLHDDVHQVATSSQSKDRLYANTAHAVYVSEDRGDSWNHRSEGLPVLYGRAITVHPEDPDCLLASVSTGPHGDAKGYLYQTEDAGHSWTHVVEGFPSEVQGNIDTSQVSFTPNGDAWAAVGKLLYTSTDRGLSWEEHWRAPEDIHMISTSLN
jgi:hypothetical protein